MPKDDIVRTACFLDLVKPFRSSFVYGNWTYDLVSEAVERATGKLFGTFVKERLLDPLGMQRTTSDTPRNENTAPLYAVRNKGIACTFPFLVTWTKLGWLTAARGRAQSKTCFSCTNPYFPHTIIIGRLD